MKNIDRADRISEIIERWFNREFEDAADEERVGQMFFDWLTNEEDSQEKERVVERMMANESNITADNSIKRSYDRYAQFIESQGGFSPQSRSLKVKKNISLGKRLMRVAAVIVPLLVVGAGVWFYVAKSDENTRQYAYVYDVLNGETETVNLPDSTNIKINSGSKLDVNYVKGTREIALSGEAYFDVARDEQRPFIVRANELSIKVLGTRFNVEAYDERDLVTVLLIDGSVSLETNSGEEMILKPNQLYVYNKAKKIGTVQNLTGEEIDEMASWSQGRVVYNYRTIRDIFGIIERRFAVDIEVQPGVELTDTEYVIKIESDETPEMIIGAFAALTDKFSYRTEGGKILIMPPVTHK